MKQKQSKNGKITFEVSYHTTEEISLYYTEIMYIEYHNRGVWLVDCNKSTYRLKGKSLNQIKKILIKEYWMYNFYSLRDALIPTHHIEKLKITEWNRKNEILLQEYIEEKEIPIPNTRLKDYFYSFKP